MYIVTASQTSDSLGLRFENELTFTYNRLVDYAHRGLYISVLIVQYPDTIVMKKLLSAAKTSTSTKSSALSNPAFDHSTVLC